jgi:predicted transposase/invertase (TIGR01784 family)
MAEKRQLTAHDYFFKQIFAERKQVQDFIRGEFPETFVQQLDFSTLQPDESHYVNPEMKEYAADVLYTCRYAGTTELRLAFLLEHKSFVPSHPHLQLLRYMLNIWEKDTQGNQPLKPIIPVVVYHGTGRWQQRPFAEYFGAGTLDDFLQPFVPSFDYWLTDLRTRSKEQIQQQFEQQLRLVFQVMKFIYDHDLLEKLESEIRSARVWHYSEQGQEFLKKLILYIHQGTKLSPLKINEAMKNYLLEMEPEEGTSAWHLKQEGRQEGKREERIEVARKMKAKGSSVAFICEITGLTEEEVKAL